MTAPAAASTSASARPGTMPPRHVSIRVPWHDDWRGTICRRPIEDSACLILERIGKTRDDKQEEADAGRRWDELPPERNSRRMTDAFGEQVDVVLRACRGRRPHLRDFAEEDHGDAGVCARLRPQRGHGRRPGLRSMRFTAAS